ncbi:hypothetical protein G3598_002452 [Listeria monocytogenes]|nr:hypothetical protein [Listeria monocytogenes]EAF8771717.1 hypothetical protein [Listeria monocytogenes]EEA6131046.1 hypothetical protein [Listeria monocytogenes]
MDYKAFFHDVGLWMDDSNEQLKQYSLFAREYWDWVMRSTSLLCDKYDNHPLVMRQVKMLYEYQEALYLKYKDVNGP